MVEVTQADKEQAADAWEAAAMADLYYQPMDTGPEHGPVPYHPDGPIGVLAKAFAHYRIAHQPPPSAEQATVDRIVAFAFKEAAERLADECERDSEVITELATAIQRGDWK